MKPRIPEADAESDPVVPSLETSADSIAHLEQALAAAPVLKATRWRLAEAYWNQGDPAAAARTLAESPSWPEDVDLLEFAGQVFLETNHGAAEDVFEEILYRDPRHIDAHRRLAELCREDGRNGEAREHERAADSIRDNPVPERRAPIWASPALMIRRKVQRALKKRTRVARASSISIALALHVLLILLFALWIVSDGDHWAAVRLEASPAPPEPPREPGQQFVDAVQQKPQAAERKQSPPLVASVDPVPIFVPKIDDRYVDDSLDAEFGAPLSPFGSGSAGGTGGAGGEAGGEVEFFGTRSHAERVVFIVDFSSSMRKGRRLELLKKELYKALASLADGMLFNIIYYSDTPWVGSFVTRKSLSRPLPSKVNWRIADKTAIRMTTAEIANMRAGGPTYWTPPLKLATAMDPKPDLIWLLSDGDSADRRSLIRKLDQLVPEGIRINTVGLELGGLPFQSLIDIAAKTGGTHSIIMGGIQYSGEEALRFTNPVYGEPEN
ncbi:MAG: hypothetical protein ACR2RV_30025 [Verrucomicrobiales bacterium]